MSLSTHSSPAPVSSAEPALPAATLAALLLVARQHLAQLNLSRPSVAEIIKGTKATKSRAYELTERLSTLLSQLVGPNGRPKKSPPPFEDGLQLQLAQRVLSYVMEHPGCVSGSANRRSYSDDFRCHILKLHAEYSDRDLSWFSSAVGISAHTLEDWLRPGRKISSKEESRSSSSRQSNSDNDPDISVQVGQIISSWRKWKGNFISFCRHVKEQLRIPFGPHLVRTILSMYGERMPRRRRGRAPDEEAIREQYQRFFPGAQWQGDGMQIPVVINGERFKFNLQLNVDSFSGAWVGMAIRDEEDSQGVIEAMKDGVQTTGEPPLSEVLDHRSCNETDEVQEAMDDLEVALIHATKGRPQNKAHVEGSFGLFSQEAPPLEIQASNPHELAKEILKLILQTFGRKLNHRPRKDRNGENRVDSYRNNLPNEEQIAETKQALKEILRRQEERRKNDEARSDPLVCQMLDEAFKRLELEETTKHLRNAIAVFGRDAVLEGIAIFEGKKKNGTLPPNVDARYLLGIVKNLYWQQESDAITQVLIELRIDMHDRQLRELEALRVSIIEGGIGPRDVAQDLCMELVNAERKIDQRFWVLSLGNFIVEQPASQREVYCQEIADMINVSFAVPPRDREKFIRQITRIIWPAS